MSIQCVVFDFGGVLIGWDPRRIYRRYFVSDAAINAFLEEIKFTEWNAEQDRGRPFNTAVALWTAKFPQYAAQIRAYDEEWIESVTGPVEGTVAILERLYERGMPLYALSNWSAEKFRLVRGRYPFLKRFREIIISGEVGMVKPERAIFQLAVRRTGWPAQECLLIDDSMANIQAAREVGMTAIHFQSPGQLERELQELGLISP